MLGGADGECSSRNTPQLAAEVSSGSQLCRALVKCFDAVLLKPQDQQQYFVMKATVINALKSLLATSATAKATAIDGDYS